jgi:hypothetical protein
MTPKQLVVIVQASTFLPLSNIKSNLYDKIIFCWNDMQDIEKQTQKKPRPSLDKVLLFILYEYKCL